MKTVLYPALVLACSLFAAGCTPPSSSARKDDAPKDNTGIFGKKTGEIGEFDPNAGAEVSDSAIDKNRLATPVIGAASAVGPLMEQSAKLAVTQALNFFYAEHGRYPKDHEEFMQKVMVYYQLDGKLPVLPGGNKYQYDVENHELVVIKGDGKADIPEN